MGIKLPLNLHRRTAISLAFAGLAAAGLASAADPVSVPTLLPQGAGTTRGLSLDGVVQPLRQATLAAQVGGNVVSLSVKAGDRVRAGQAVARVDERELQAGLQRSEAGVSQAEAEFRNARLQAERSRDLRQQGFVSQAALDVAETQFKAAQAGLQQAQAGRSQAALARGFTTVVAPFDAVVLATHVEAGDLATPGRPIATVYAPGAMRAVVQVPASMAGAARSATSVLVQLPDGRSVEPIARAVLPVADPVSQTVEWRLDLPASASTGDAPVLPGQSVQVAFVGGAAAAPATPGGALTIPSAALLRRGELTAVYVVQEQRFVLRAVRTGAHRGAAGVDILAGLKPGERLAADAVKAGLAGAVPAAR
ncbi:efflux RND transporter periplasmic adaptor subunit [Ideonella sp. A 288]|uniref:efflux RND transporter periplasmic adaptor subunit n=1 Tax=Ideonella sp. A 288 TaxID=1962181 RepID=UPI000B4B4EBC|nr:efflux RND transporter periplasmic adaptor subunit [Ideonella sp. A 288]